MRSMFRVTAFGFTICSIFFPDLAKAQDELSRVVIEAIDGANSVTLSKRGKKKEATVGDFLNVGERVITNGPISATILYPDGSRVVVTKNTDFEIEKEIEGVQWNKLRRGVVRGIIHKIAIPTTNKPRFLIRTKSAVLGVRGTDFVMALDSVSGNAQIHTIEGLVDIARNEVSLMSGQSTHLAEGQFLEVNISGVSAPQSFNPSEFLKSFSELLDTSVATIADRSVASEVGPQGRAISAPPVVNSAPDLTPSLPSFNRAKPPEDTAQKEKDDIQVENSVETHKAPAEVSRFKLIAFQAGVFFAQMPASNPSLNNTMENIRAITVAWTPTIPVPFIPFLSFRGNVGGSFALQGSLNNNFLVKELQLFLTFTLLDLLYVEGGAGKQFWQGYRTFSGPLHSVNAGLLFRIGLIDRIFIGYQSLDTSPRFNQYKAGIGMSF